MDHFSNLILNDIVLLTNIVPIDNMANRLKSISGEEIGTSLAYSTDVIETLYAIPARRSYPPWIRTHSRPFPLILKCYTRVQRNSRRSLNDILKSLPLTSLPADLSGGPRLLH